MVDAPQLGALERGEGEGEWGRGSGVSQKSWLLGSFWERREGILVFFSMPRGHSFSLWAPPSTGLSLVWEGSMWEGTPGMDRRPE